MLQLVLVARSAVLSGVGVMQHFHVGIKLAEEPHRFSVLKLNSYGLNLEKVCKGSGHAARNHPVLQRGLLSSRITLIQELSSNYCSHSRSVSMKYWGVM